MFLDTATRSLEMLLDGAVATTELPWSVDYVDLDQSTQELAGTASADGTSAGAAAVTLADAPEAGTTRKINYISIVNMDSAARTVTVRRNDGGTTRVVWLATLQPGDMAFFTDASGWQTLSSSGAIEDEHILM